MRIPTIFPPGAAGLARLLLLGLITTLLSFPRAAASDGSTYDEFPLGRFVAGAPLYTARPTQDNHVALAPLGFLRLRNSDESAPGHLTDTYFSSPPIGITRLGGTNGEAGGPLLGFGPVIGQPAVFTRGVDADFELALSPFTAYSLTSSAAWQAAALSGRNAAVISNLDADAPAEDWLISPPYTVTADEPVSLTFDFFQSGSDNNASLRVYVSQNHAGGTPILSQWTEITPASLASTPANTWREIGPVGITGVTGDNVRVAFRYLSTGTTAGSARMVGVDNVALFQNLYLPPAIDSFKADGIELVDGRVFTGDPRLEVTASNLARVARAEFAYRAAGSSTFTTLGQVIQTSAGMQASWQVAQIPDGHYELAARLWNGGKFTERIHPVIVALAPPAAPLIVQPASSGNTTNLTQNVRLRAADGTLVRLFRNGQAVASGRPVGGADLVFPVDLSLGENTFTATAENRAGSSPASNGVTVTRERPIPVLTLTLENNTLIEGETMRAEVRLQNALEENIAITLSSSRPTEVATGPPVTLEAGQTLAVFTVSALEDTRLQSLRNVTLEAGTPRAVPVNRGISVLDNDIPLLELELERSVVSETDGPNALTATLTRDLSFEAQTVQLIRSQPTLWSAPASVTFAPGQDRISFPIGVNDNATADGPRDVTMHAVLRFENGTTASTSPTRTLTITDDDSPQLQLVFNREFLREGQPETIRIRRISGILTEPVEVTLTSSSERLLPQSPVVIPAGAVETTATLDAPANDSAGDTTRLTLDAAAPGHGGAQITLVVVDATLPDLVALDLDSATSLETEATFPLRYRIENQGIAATAIPFQERVYFSRDTVLGNDDILVSEQLSPETLAVGAGYDRQITARAPLEAGRYWLIVQVDAGDQIGEILETNNTRVFATPLEVQAAYSARVSTPESSYPANTPIPLTGSAERADGTPVPFASVHIHIQRGNIRRTIAAITDASGDFTTQWQPLTGEGGDYTLAASHPGLSEAPVQDSFSILSFTHDFPTKDPLNFEEGSGTSRNFRISNPSPSQNLTGVRFELIGAPVGLDTEIESPGDILGAGASWDLTLLLTADPGLSGTHRPTLRLVADGGVVVEIPLTLEIRPLVPRLAADPLPLQASAIRGQQKTVSLRLTNTGGAATGPIQLLLPNLPWLRVASANPLPSLAPSESADVTLLLSPTSSQALTVTSGTLVARPATGDSLQIPFDFRTVSSSFGNLTLQVVNEFFFFTEDAPALAGATVVLRDAITAEEISRVVTPVSGEVTFPQLPEGYYQIDASAPSHSARTLRVFVAAGENNRRQLFLSRELVTYSWRVEEVQIADRYEITVETTFETNVPAPVITVTPGRIDVADLVGLGATKVVNLTVENHGWIAAEAEALRFDDHPFYRFEPLVGSLGTLAAKSKVVVPVVVTRIGVFGPDDQIVTLDSPDSSGRNTRNTGRPRVSCVVSGGLPYSYECGENNVGKESPVAVSGVQGNCPDSGPGGGGGGIAQPISTPSGPGGGSSTSPQRFVSVPVATTIQFPTPTTCDCPFFTKVCWPFAPKVNLAGIGKQMGAMISAALPPYLKVGTVEVTLSAEGEACLCCEEGRYSWSGNGTLKAEVKVPISAGLTASKEFEFSGGGFETVKGEVSGLLGAKTEVTGTLTASGSREYCGKEISWCAGGSIQGDIFLGGELTGNATATEIDPESGGENTYTGSVEGRIGISAKVNASVSGCSKTGLEFKACATTVPVASVEAKMDLGSGEIKVASASIDFEKYRIGGCPDDSGGGGGKSLAGRSTRDDPPADDPFADDGRPWDRDESEPIRQVLPTSSFETPDEELYAQYAPGIFQDEGVCAKVRIRLSQQLVLTRSAFLATLELGNNLPDENLTEVGFDLNVRDSAGEPADDVFNLRVTELRGLNAVDGSGLLSAGATGSAQWTLIPRDDAAPLGDTTYYVGGTIRYRQAGALFSIPVSDVPITVRPDARLHLKYFHQRDVFADDPFTPDVIEPSQPYALAVLVENRGAGAARDLSITSAQPLIVDNEKGLLVDFRILGTEVNGQPLSPSLTTRFGTLPPQSTAVGVWQLKSSLQGLFTDYSASFEHIDGLGDPRLSLIREVEIHEMTRLVQILGPDDDGLPDFLTNDIPDHNHFPDTIHFSTGGSAPVVVHENANITQRTLPDGSREIEINSALGQGWGYLRIPDPLGPDWHLVSGSRPDGRNLPVERNIWRTDRTFPGLNQKARAERILHLFDGNSNGRHTLVFQPAPAADVTPPESSILPLPDQSPAVIPLTWGGNDEGGIAWYDIFVSTNNGPWTPWLERSALTAALFTGETGSTYAFYSRATDLSGNVESKTPNAETVTTVSLANTPPIATPTGPISVDAGHTLSLQLAATDPDGPDSELRFQLVSGPSGMTVDPLTGQVRWVTATSDGGRSLEAVVAVTDTGLPPASAEFRIPIQVRRINRAPILDPPTPRTLAVGETLVQALIARDDDVPTQTLRFSIVSGAPNGLTLDPETGILRWTASRAQAGTSYPLVIAVTDDGEPAATTTRSFPLNVANVPLGPPVFDPLPAPLWLSGSPRELAIRATDPDGTPVTISATNLPPGATFLASPGSGHATLRWTPATHHAGLHLIQLTATTPGEATQTSLTLRVENPDDYWTWAADAFGLRNDPGDYGPLADPDNDGSVNLVEQLFFRDPLTPDNTPLDFEKIGDIDDQWSLFRMEFLRHESARRHIRNTPLHSTDLDNWQPLMPWTYQPSIRRATAPDSPPGAEEVELRLLMPRSALNGYFQLETTLLPPWSEASP